MPIIGPEAEHNQGMRSIRVVPDTLDREALLADFGRDFVLRPADMRSLRTTWFDSFDWRLARRGRLLWHDGEAWYLVRRKNGRLIRLVADPPATKAVFPADLPPSGLRDFLASSLAMRCLLPLFSDTMTLTAWTVKNRDEKTVVHVVIEEHRFPPSDDPYRVIRLDGVRGYPGYFRRADRFLATYGLQPVADPFSFFERGTASRGRLPLDYSSRFHIDLQPEMPARQAMVAIYLQLLDTMRRNESGIIEDLDSEFLHDFRVAIRRTRSGLTQVKKVLPARVTGEFKEKFAWLGAITGPTRDLDVYLLQEEDYRCRLPEVLHAGLAPFFAGIRERRLVEQKKLGRHLRSEKYKKILRSWQDVLEGEAAASTAKRAELPVLELSCRIIHRQFHELVKAGEAIGPRSPDADLHRLRIQGKKLRYNLEFFAALYPEREIRRVIKQLKRLQDNLGTFNDLSVQQEMLHGALGSLRPGSQKNQKTAAALGGLLTNLYHEHQRVRDDFAARFRKFASPENRALYGELFRSGQ